MSPMTLARAFTSRRSAQRSSASNPQPRIGNLENNRNRPVTAPNVAGMTWATVAILLAQLGVFTVESARAAGDAGHPVLDVAERGRVLSVIGPVVFVDVHVRLFRTDGQPDKIVIPVTAGRARLGGGEVGHGNGGAAGSTARLQQRAGELVERVEGLLVADSMHDQDGGVLRHPLAGTLL